MGKSFFLRFLPLIYLLPIHLEALTDAAINAKCAPSEKNSIITTLNQQKATQPQLAGAIDACISSLNNAYNSCVNTVKTAAATAAGTMNSAQLGQAQQFQGQENMSKATSGMSQQDQAANQACANQYASAQSSCSFPGGQAAQGHASKVQALCASDAAQAASNTQNMEQMSDAAKQLTPQSPQSPTSPTANTPSYTPPTNTPTTTTSTVPNNTNPNLNIPNYNPLANTGKENKNLTIPNTPESPTLDVKAGYTGLTYDPVTFTGNEDSLHPNKNSNHGTNTQASNSNSALGLITGSGLSDSTKSKSLDSNESSENLSGAPMTTTSNNAGDGLYFANSGRPFDLSNSPGVIIPDTSIGKPITSKIVSPVDLPRKSKYIETSPSDSSPKKSSFLSSIFKRNKSSLYRNPSAENVNGPINPNGKDEDSSSRPMVLGLFLFLSALGGTAYKRYFMSA